jgi:hypothetical protein
MSVVRLCILVVAMAAKKLQGDGEEGTVCEESLGRRIGA